MAPEVRAGVGNGSSRRARCGFVWVSTFLLVHCSARGGMRADAATGGDGYLSAFPSEFLVNHALLSFVDALAGDGGASGVHGLRLTRYGETATAGRFPRMQSRTGVA